MTHTDEMLPASSDTQRTAYDLIGRDLETHCALLFEPKRAEAPQVVYVIAAHRENAEALACLIVAGHVPDLYLFACDCLKAWRESGLVEQRRYQPWAVTFQRVLDRLLIKSSSQLIDRQEKRT